MLSIHEARLHGAYKAKHVSTVQLLASGLIPELLINHCMVNIGFLLVRSTDSLEQKRVELAEVAAMLDSLHFKIHGRYPTGDSQIVVDDSNTVNPSFNGLAIQVQEATESILRLELAA